MKRVLMVAFHMPPLARGSGIQRTLRFVQQLPDWGWRPLVLSADPRAYAETGPDLMGEIPPDTLVHRSFALDAARHLAVRGRYLGWTARPDRWVSWKWAAVRDGMRLLEQHKPELIWSTYPIATAHMIGAELSRRSGIPWVADFRDPMAQDGYPADPAVWRSFKAIEEQAVASAAACVFTTPGAARTYGARYSHAAGRMRVIENGYDESSFAGIPTQAERREPLLAGKVTLLHSGTMYPSERDPSCFFAALRSALARGGLRREQLCVRFRAPGHGDEVMALAVAQGVQDVIEIAPPLPYREALLEMSRADGLLLLQAANCNDQIPAKFYEYLRAARPVLGLTDHAGDTAGAMRKAGLEAIAALDSAAEIEAVLTGFVDDLLAGRAAIPGEQAIRDASRYSRAKALAELFEQVVAA